VPHAIDFPQWLLKLKKSAPLSPLGGKPTKSWWLKSNISLMTKKADRAQPESPGFCKKKVRSASRHRVDKLTRNNGLRAKAAKKYKAKTNSNHSLPVAPNLLEQNFTADVSV